MTPGRPIAFASMVAFALAGRAGIAHAGLDLAWKACSQMPTATSSQVADCANSTVLDLYGTLQLDSDFPGFVDLEMAFDLRTTALAMPAIWNVESNACGGGQDVLLDLGGTGPQCPVTSYSFAIWNTNRSIQSEIHYSIDPEDPRHARLQIVGHRSSRDPTVLRAGTNYAVFGLALPLSRATESGGLCGGCDAPLAIVWNSATLHSASASRTISGPGLGSSCVTLNGAPLELCGVTPVRARTWGTVRTLYR